MSERTDVTKATLRMNSGRSIPQIGLGVWQIGKGEPTRKAVTAALRSGYRHVDTARIYGNESDVGAAIRASALPREEVFVTTKLWNDDQGYESALRAFEQSLGRLGLEHVDLYLLHWPVAGRRLDSWRALERLQAEGRVKDIGVSNFLVPHLEELVRHARVIPAVNQIEVSPFLQRPETRAWCREHGIVVEAYSPLTHGHRLDHPVLTRVARSAERTPAQVLLRWAVQRGMVVLPKSSRPERIAENAALYDFELDEESMSSLDALEEGLTTGWNPESER